MPDIPQSIQTDFDLSRRNTLGVTSHAQYFCEADSTRNLQQAFDWARKKNLKVHILGGGSNLLLAPEIKGLVVAPHIALKSTTVKTPEVVRLKFGAGEVWHEVVQWCMNQGYYGLENLALIPGCVGAAPVQNIGAYGVELDSVLVGLTAMNIQTGAVRIFTAPQCEFKYRDSVFKQRLKNTYVILDVSIKLSRQAAVKTAYPALKEQLKNIAQPTPQDVFNAVCDIRQKKLPDPKVLPNCGSFFKNPIVSGAQFETLKSEFPNIVAFPMPGLTDKKLAAAWLIDRAGWRGKSRYNVAVHQAQALVLVNPERESAQQVINLARDIKADVLSKFKVCLELEPQQFSDQ